MSPCKILQSYDTPFYGFEQTAGRVQGGYIPVQGGYIPVQGGYIVMSNGTNNNKKWINYQK